MLQALEPAFVLGVVENLPEPAAFAGVMTVLASAGGFLWIFSEYRKASAESRQNLDAKDSILVSLEAENTRLSSRNERLEIQIDEGRERERHLAGDIAKLARQLADAGIVPTRDGTVARPVHEPFPPAHSAKPRPPEPDDLSDVRQA